MGRPDASAKRSLVEALSFGYAGVWDPSRISHTSMIDSLSYDLRQNPSWSVPRRSDSWVLALWAFAGYRNQRQIQVTHLGQHAVQRSLIYDLSREHGLSILQVGDL
jgi:hypothetical protein